MIRGSFVFVSNLPLSTTEEEVRDLFGHVGEVTNVRIEYDVRTNRSTGSGFVQLSDDYGARNAVEQLNGFSYQGYALRVNHSRKAARTPDANLTGGRAETLIKVAGFVMRTNSNRTSLISEQSLATTTDSEQRAMMPSNGSSVESSVPEEPTPPFQRNTISRRSFTFNHGHGYNEQDMESYRHHRQEPNGHLEEPSWNGEKIYHVGGSDHATSQEDEVPPLFERHDSLRPSDIQRAPDNGNCNGHLADWKDNSFNQIEAPREEPSPFVPINSSYRTVGLPGEPREQRYTVHHTGLGDVIQLSDSMLHGHDPESLSRITECSEETVIYHNVGTPDHSANVGNIANGVACTQSLLEEHRFTIYASERPAHVTVGSGQPHAATNDTQSWIAELVQQASDLPVSRGTEQDRPVSSPTSPKERRRNAHRSKSPDKAAKQARSPPPSPKKGRVAGLMSKLQPRKKNTAPEPYTGPIRNWYRSSVIRDVPIENYVAVYHPGRSDEPSESRNAVRSHADDMTRSQITRYFQHATTLQDYPVSEPYAGPLSPKRRSLEVAGQPIEQYVTVYHSGRSDEAPPLPDEVPSPDPREGKQGRMSAKKIEDPRYPTHKTYAGPVYTYRNTDFHAQPLEQYVTVYHSGRSDQPDLLP